MLRGVEPTGCGVEIMPVQSLEILPTRSLETEFATERDCYEEQGQYSGVAACSRRRVGRKMRSKGVKGYGE